MSSGKWRICFAIMLVIAMIVPAAPLIAAGGPGGGGGGGGGAGGGGHTPGEESEDAGNNLSWPVTLVDAGTFGTLTLGTVDFVGGGEHWWCLEADPAVCQKEPFLEEEAFAVYVQKDPLNVWQAHVATFAGETLPVQYLNWGDNLEVNDWRTGMTVRTEMQLYYDGLGEENIGYDMFYLEGQGPGELWGSSGNQNSSNPRLIYSGKARLTIQEIDPENAPTVWDPELAEWEGAPVKVKVSASAGTYSAEQNVSGKIVYGYNWVTRSYAVGTYRLTFSFEEPSVAQIDSESILFEEIPAAEEISILSEEGDTEYDNQAVIDGALGITYLDVQLVPKGRPVRAAEQEREQEQEQEQAQNQNQDCDCNLACGQDCECHEECQNFCQEQEQNQEQNQEVEGQGQGEQEQEQERDRDGYKTLLPLIIND